MTTLADGTFVPVFEFNPTIDRLAARLRDSGTKGFWRETQSLSEAVTRTLSLADALEYLEVATAAEIYSYDGYSCSALARRALARIVVLGEHFQTNPDILAAHIVSRGFWGRDGQVYGRPDYGRINTYSANWNSRHRSPYSNMIRTACGWPESTVLETRAAIQRYLQNPAQANLGYRHQVYIGAYLLLGRPVEFTLTNLRMIQIGNPAELEYALNGLASVAEGSVRLSRGERLLEQGLQMVSNLIAYCANLGIDNAVQINNLITETYRRTQSPLQISTLIGLGRGLRSKAGGSSNFDGSIMSMEVPDAIDTVIEAILYMGENSASPEDRETLFGYGQLAADIFVLGCYLREQEHQPQLTVGEFLEKHPNMSAKRLNKILNPKRKGRGSGPMTDLAGTFGSIVYWERMRPGYGYVS